MLNLQIAKAYLAGTDTAITTRTWQQAIEALTKPSTLPTASVGKRGQRPRARATVVTGHHRNTQRIVVEDSPSEAPCPRMFSCDDSITFAWT